MTTSCLVIWTFLLLCISSLAFPSSAPLQADAIPAPALAPAPALTKDLSTDEPIPITSTDNTSEFKFINTYNYYWRGNGNKYVVVDAQDPKYTIKYGSEVSCANNLTGFMFDQLRAVSVDGTDLLLLADSRGRLVTLPQNTQNPENCPIVTNLLSGAFGSTSLDVHRSLGIQFVCISSPTQLRFEFTVFKLRAEGNHMPKAHMNLAPFNHGYSFAPITYSMTTLFSLGNTGDNVVVFTPAEHGVTAHYGHINGILMEFNVSAGSELQSATGCHRMTRIGVSDPLSTTTTVTLAVACADDGAGTPAVYVVQVPVVDGVPQTLTVTASMVLKTIGDEGSVVSLGGMDYLNGSLIVSTRISIYSFVITNPELPSTTLTLRSLFEYQKYIYNVVLLTESVAVISLSDVNYVSSVVLDLEHGQVMQPPVIQRTANQLVGGLTGSRDEIIAGARLSDMSFVSVGYFNDIRRWESCAGLGHDYTSVVLDTSDPSAPSATCGCPADKYCLLGTTYDICPPNTTKDGQKCVPSPNGLLINKPALSVIQCPASHYCVNNVQYPCTGTNYTASDAGDYVTEGASKCTTCSAGYKCKDGVRTPCNGDEYQPHEAQTFCYTCPDHSDANTDNTYCTVHDGYAISSGSLENGDAVLATCPAGYKCVGGVKALGTTLIAAIVVAVVVVCVLAAGLTFFLHRKSRNSKADANTTELTQV